MRDALLLYFAGEKHAGLLAALVGAVALAAALMLWSPRWGLRPFAVALGIIGLVELAIGVGLYLKTGPQVERLVAQLEREPARLYADEGARMAKVQRNFVYLEYGWIVLVVGAAVTAVAAKERHGLSSVALALALQGSFFLAFDLVAERRGAVYLAALRSPGT
jgi:hypothetical protein